MMMILTTKSQGSVVGPPRSRSMTNVLMTLKHTRSQATARVGLDSPAAGSPQYQPCCLQNKEKSLVDGLAKARPKNLRHWQKRRRSTPEGCKRERESGRDGRSPIRISFSPLPPRRFPHPSHVSLPSCLSHSFTHTVMCEFLTNPANGDYFTPLECSNSGY